MYMTALGLVFTLHGADRGCAQIPLSGRRQRCNVARFSFYQKSFQNKPSSSFTDYIEPISYSGIEPIPDYEARCGTMICIGGLITAAVSYAITYYFFG